MRQRSERPEEKEAGRSTDGGAGLSRVLVWREPRQRLDVADINHRIGRDGRMSGRDHAVEPVYSDKRPPERARHVAGRNLSVGQVCRDAQPVGWEQRGVDEGGDQSRDSVKAAWI